MNKFTHVLTAGLLLSSTLLNQAIAIQDDPDPSEITRAAAGSLKKLENSPASWEAELDMGNGVKISMRVVRSGDQRSTSMSVRNQHLVTITERDGLWYVIEGEDRTKYRPYEVPWVIPTVPLFLNSSDPMFLTEPDQMGDWKFLGAEDDRASYRVPLTTEYKQMLENQLTQIKTLREKDPERFDASKLAETSQKLKELITSGMEVKIDTSTGMMLESGSTRFTVRIRNFKWLENIDESQFSVDGKWADHTSELTNEDLTELVMIGHSGMWRPGVPSKDLDTRLLNIKTGTFRRVPYQDGVTMPGCFLKDRKKVVVVGMTQDAWLVPFVVDLETGENRQLGGDTLRTAMTMFPVLSPDGKKLAALYTRGDEGILERRVVMIDIESGEARNIGDPMDTAFVSWLPAGDGFILIRRETASMDEVAVATICRMDMTGKLTEIRKGDRPVVLKDGKTILFWDQEDDLWKTCDFSGGNVKLFGDGFKSHGAPAPAPDGKRVVMMHYRKDNGPIPVVIDIGKSSGSPITDRPGLWAYPNWK